MKKLLAAAGISLTLILAGCSGGVAGSVAKQSTAVSTEVTTSSPRTNTPAPTTTQPAPTLNNVELQAITQQEALTNLRSAYPIFAPESDATLILLFESTCGALDRGNSIEALSYLALDYGYTIEEGFASVVVSIASTCPEYLPDLEQFIEGSN